MYGYFCTDIKEQLLQDTIWTSIGGYILALCFLINASHWYFIASEPSIKTKRVVMGLIVFFFLVVPAILLILISIFYFQEGHVVKDVIHYIELVYAAVLNLFVAVITSVSWLVLYRRLKAYDTIDTIKKLKNQITIQMILNMSFFVIRAVCLFILGPFGHFFHDENNEQVEIASDHLRNQIIYFISAVLGDIPLAFVMLHFLQHRKGKAPPPAKNPPLMASSASSAADGINSSGGGFTGGKDIQEHYQSLADGPAGYMTTQSPMLYNQMMQMPTPPNYATHMNPNSSTNSLYYADGGGFDGGGYV